MKTDYLLNIDFYIIQILFKSSEIGFQNNLNLLLLSYLKLLLSIDFKRKTLYTCI